MNRIVVFKRDGSMPAIIGKRPLQRKGGNSDEAI